MNWQTEFVHTLGNFVKLVGFACFHGGEIPAYSMITKPVFEERNRLIVQGNERLKRIEQLEAQNKTLLSVISNQADHILNLQDTLDELTED